MHDQVLSVPAAEAERNFGLYQDKALIQPVEVVREGKMPVVMISADEYSRLKRRDRQALRVEELSDEEVALIMAAETPEEAKQFDHEVR
jgi:PHD/YefM family antitoxin component YafN of YafNO toxin-antitoxin module